MTILDDREPTVSLSVIVAFVSLVMLAGFAGLFALNCAPAAAHHAPQSAVAGNT